MDIPKIVRGNAFTVIVSVLRAVPGGDGTAKETLDLAECNGIAVRTVSVLGRRVQCTFAVDGNRLMVDFDGSLSVGRYGLEVTGFYSDGKPWRYFAAPGEFIDIVDPTSQSYTDGSTVQDSYNVEALVLSETLSAAQVTEMREAAAECAAATQSCDEAAQKAAVSTENADKATASALQAESSANAAADKANASAMSADDSAKRASDSATKADASADSATAAAKSANEAATKAGNATSEAESAATRAESATASATTASENANIAADKAVAAAEKIEAFNADFDTDTGEIVITTK